MKKIFVCCLLFVISSLVIAQHSRVEKIQQLKNRSDIKVTEVEKDVYKIENKISGDAFLEDLSNGIKYKANENIDSMVIEIFSINTSLYSDMYKHWLDIDISNSVMGLLINDFNSNALVELYGNRTLYNLPSLSPGVFELDQAGKEFDLLYVYPDSVRGPSTSSYFDVDNDGLLDILFRNSQSGRTPWPERAEKTACKDRCQ